MCEISVKPGQYIAIGDELDRNNNAGTCTQSQSPVLESGIQAASLASFSTVTPPQQPEVQELQAIDAAVSLDSLLVGSHLSSEHVQAHQELHKPAGEY